MGNIFTIKPGEWVKVKAQNHPLRGEVCQVQEINFSTLEVFHQGHGLVNFNLRDVQEARPPKSPPITPISIVAKIESLTNRYKEIGGKVDRRFVEQILPSKVVEQIFETVTSQGLDNKCSTTNIDNKCSTTESQISDRRSTSPATLREKGRPKKSKNKAPASGWIYTRQNKQTTNHYFCWRELKKVIKTPIPAQKVEAVKGLIQAGCSINQVLEYLSNLDEVIF
ncbi:MAG: hypothetical protein AAGJ08_25095 [Cyanobacteria bacterium P01_H01_bin.35]